MSYSRNKRRKLNKLEKFAKSLTPEECQKIFEDAVIKSLEDMYGKEQDRTE